MLGKTHTVIGCALTLPLVLQGDISPIYAMIGLVGAGAPDIDQTLHLHHRGFSHSLAATVLTTILIGLFSKELAFVWGVNYLGHILADSFTTKGVQILWPSKKFFGLKLFKVTPSSDMVVFILAVLVIIYEVLTMTTLGGFILK